MNKIVGLLLIISTVLIAKSGEEIFKNKCQKCHVEYIPMDKLKENFMKYNNTKLKLKAPTLNMLSFRLKEQIGSREDDPEFHQFQVTEFIKSYVKEPDSKKSLCMDKILKIFHTMHSMKGKISDEQLAKVAEYIYYYDINNTKRDIGKKSIDYENIFKRAKKENKIVLIKCESEYCHYCKKMESDIFTLPKIKEMIDSHFIDIKVDLYKDKLPLNLKVELTPTFIFINGNKRVIEIVRGSFNQKDLLYIFKKVIKERDK